jgi:hypothetical protein
MAYTEEVLAKMAEAQDKFVWESPAWERHERHPHWYLIMSGVALVFVAFAVFTANYLFAFIIFLVAIILVLAGNEEPHTMLVQIGDNGVVVDGKLHLFNQLREFGVVYQPPDTKLLYLEPKALTQGRVRILLQDQDPVELRAHLLQYISEDVDLRHEHASDIIGRLLKI